jgi:CRISPR-associated protein Cas2
MDAELISINGYRAMWLIAMFDLPVTTKDARREYTRFRDALLQEGFTMLQYSVYARYCENEERGATFRRRIRRTLPPEGQVRVVSITDIQFGKMEVYYGKKQEKVENQPEQIMLF